MKKSLFGYSITETNHTLNTLRAENESLNSTILSLTEEVKKYKNRTYALEEEIHEYKENLNQITNINDDLVNKISELYFAVITDEENEQISN